MYFTTISNYLLLFAVGFDTEEKYLNIIHTLSLVLIYKFQEKGVRI